LTGPLLENFCSSYNEREEKIEKKKIGKELLLNCIGEIVGEVRKKQRERCGSRRSEKERKIEEVCY
jgi:hypothetical protein